MWMFWIKYNFIAVYTFSFKPLNHEPIVNDQGNTASEKKTILQKEMSDPDFVFLRVKQPGLLVW